VDDAAPTAAPPECSVAGVARTSGGGIAADFVVHARGSRQKDERMWEAVSEGETTTDAEGRFEIPFECGLKMAIKFPGWLWGNEPPEVWSEPGGGDIDVELFAEREVKLFLHDAAGQPVAGEFVPVGGGAAVPVPVDGVELEGVTSRDLAGTVRAEGLGERAWRLHRSDDLREVAPRHFEAVVRIDGGAPLWVYPPADRDVSGVWCLAAGARGAECKLREGAWYCECGGADQVAVATKLWDVAIVRDVAGKDLQLDAWPATTPTCLQVPGGGVAKVRPVGVDDTLLLGASGPANRFCVDLPHGETVRVVGTAAQWDHVVQGGGDVTLDEAAAVEAR